MLRHLQSISIAILLLLCSVGMHARDYSFPQNEGDKARYSVQIDFKKAYISGVGIIAMLDGNINGSVFNEFGVSVLSFTYNPQKDKVKILSVFEKMNKWYIKKVLKRDLKHVLHQLANNDTTYKDERFQITYTFTPLEEIDETSE